MNDLGTDVSHWQDNNSTPEMIDFEKMKKAGAVFTYIKASQAKYKDEDIVLNWQHAKEAEILRGAYHFLVWDVDPIQQADFFCLTLGDDPGELPPICDYEWWSTVPANSEDILAVFMGRVEKNLQRIPGIYTAPGFWSPYGNSDPMWAHYYLWVAHWGVSVPLVPAPWQNWTFWQYTNKGSGPTYGAESLDLDMDWFNNGVYGDLRKFCGLETQPDTTQEQIDALRSELSGIKAQLAQLVDWKNRPL